jgi:hypothetical protein
MTGGSPVFIPAIQVAFGTVTAPEGTSRSRDGWVAGRPTGAVAADADAAGMTAAGSAVRAEGTPLIPRAPSLPCARHPLPRTATPNTAMPR